MKLKKMVAGLIAVSMLAFPVVSFSADDTISLTINGEQIETQVPPTIIDGRTMVPVRDIFEACGANVDWDAQTKTITGTKGDTTVVMQIDSNTMFINENVVTMDATPVILDGRTLAPARYVAESFGGIVDWDAENKVVMIDVDEDAAEETTQVTTTVITTEATTATETTTETTTEATTVTETTTAATTVAEASDMIVKTVRGDIEKAIGTYSLGSYETAGKFKTTVLKQTMDNWASMATTSVDKKYVAASRTFFNRLATCYKSIDNIYIDKNYNKRLSDLRVTMTDYKTKANEIVSKYLKTRNVTEINNLSNELSKFTSDMKTNMKVLYDNT